MWLERSGRKQMANETVATRCGAKRAYPARGKPLQPVISKSGLSLPRAARPASPSRPCATRFIVPKIGSGPRGEVKQARIERAHVSTPAGANAVNRCGVLRQAGGTSVLASAHLPTYRGLVQRQGSAAGCSLSKAGLRIWKASFLWALRALALSVLRPNIGSIHASD